MAGMNVEAIPVDKIGVGLYQVRVSNVMEGIDDLAENIKVQGLRHPITVCRTDDGKYELIAGQRRLMAIKKLGLKTIEAQVLPKPANQTIGKAWSFAENEMVLPMTESDKIEACTEFYEIYGSFKIVAEKTGLNGSIVKKYVKIASLPNELKEMVRSGDIKVNLALKARDIAEKPDGSVDAKEAVEVAKNIRKMQGSQIRLIVKRKTEEPELTPTELIETGNVAPRVKVIKPELHVTTFDALKRYTEKEGMESEEEAAAELITDGLTTRGFIKKE